MRRVARTDAAPAELEAAAEIERERARAHHSARTGDVAVSDDVSGKKSFEYKAYKLDAVKRELETLFHGKCAYCETYYAASGPVDVEHYRPKGAVSEDPEHPGYWWLAMSWSNLLPSCLDCNRRRKQFVPSNAESLLDLYSASARHAMTSVQSGKKDSFPLSADSKHCRAEQDDLEAERPLLLDPTRDEPDEHLAWHLDPDDPIALILPVAEAAQGERARVSIHTYGLNRLDLVQARTRVLRRLMFLGDVVTELGVTIDALRQPKVVDALAGVGAHEMVSDLQRLQDKILAELRAMAEPDAPYSMMARAWIDRFIAAIAAAPTAP